MPIELARFFINFLPDRGDLVLDPFGGSNTTGAAAEALGRFWISIEAEEMYIQGSHGRFGEFTRRLLTQAEAPAVSESSAA